MLSGKFEKEVLKEMLSVSCVLRRKIPIAVCHTVDPVVFGKTQKMIDDFSNQMPHKFKTTHFELTAQCIRNDLH